MISRPWTSAQSRRRKKPARAHRAPPNGRGHQREAEIRRHHARGALLLVALAAVACLAATSHGGHQWMAAVEASDFVDASLKPNLVLIVPQSFKVPFGSGAGKEAEPTTDSGEPTSGSPVRQYVALINHYTSERDDRQLRQQFKRLALQVRDARSPLSGHLYYEHVFDYFAPGARNQHLLIPVNLDQVLATQAGQTADAPDQSGVAETSRPQQLVVSVRPHPAPATGFGGDTIELVSSAPVPIEPIPSADGRRSFAIVQTDRPIYKPTDKVRIRSLVINENLLPMSDDELRLQIRNPHKVVVEEVRFPYALLAKTSLGAAAAARPPKEAPLFLDHTFEFPPEPMPGAWSAHVLHSDPIANDSIAFEVREYTLPTHEVHFFSPSYVLPSSQLITGHILAKYHHGRPVQGKAQFKFGYRPSPSSTTKWIARSSIKNVDPSTGRVEYRMSTDKFKEIEWFPGIAGSRLVIEATVTEMATGHREVVTDTSCVFLATPYRFHFDDSMEDFKTGMSQPLTVQLREAQTDAPAPAGARIVAQYRDQNGTLLVGAGSSSSSSSAGAHGRHSRLGPKMELDQLATTDSNGRATFNVGPFRPDITTIQATFKWLNTSNPSELKEAQVASSPAGNELAIGQHTLIRHESTNGWLSIMNKSETLIKVGDEFVSDVLIREAVVVPQKIYYMLASKGRIMSVEPLNAEGLIKFAVTDQMVPSIRLVLFALTHDSVGLLSDSMRLHVAQDLDCGLRLAYNAHTAHQQDDGEPASVFRPNEKGRLAIQARPGDHVSLIAIDSALYTLNNRTRLEAARIVERVKRLDLGCGFGGGRNTLDVFHNAGLMVFREPASRTAPGAQLGSYCFSVPNQLRHIEDMQLGYARPMFTLATQMHRTRSLNALALSAARERARRSKREVAIETLLKRYSEPLQVACCRLGTLEDIPARRNCNVRARIVDKYMRAEAGAAESSPAPASGQRSCALVYLDCCREVFGDPVALGSMLGARDSARVYGLLYALAPAAAVRSGAGSDEADALARSSNLGRLDQIEASTLVRRDFRETWLFEVVPVKAADGFAAFDLQLPHSITSWTLSAVALNRRLPMCLPARPLTIAAFQSLFMQVAMPYKVVQGEQIDLAVTLFNYANQSQEVFAYVYGVESVCSEAEPGERSERKRVYLEALGSQTVLFPMIPLSIGKFPVRVVAISGRTGASDIVEKQLNVVARGKTVTDETTFSLDPLNLQRRNKRAIQTGNLLDDIDSSRGLQRSRVRLVPTRDAELVVPRTQECIVSAIGDKLGHSVQTAMLDVESLVRLPRGCGEQVMIYLGPTLYTARYLSSINRLTGELRWRAIRYIQSGYKRILNYRSDEGAFSAFARREPSIWLTAFVTKLLCQTETTPFVAEEIHVDRAVVSGALRWLIARQDRETGTWTELNPVYHREMLGGVLRANALTAFVSISLTECLHHAPELVDEATPTAPPTSTSASASARAPPKRPAPGMLDDPAAAANATISSSLLGRDRLHASILAAAQALVRDRHKASRERNAYVMALGAYALSAHRPQEAYQALEELLGLGERSIARNQLSWRGDYHIETAAYALQTIVELLPYAAQTGGVTATSRLTRDAGSIVNWLASKRSFSGAFESTQDTVVALEALSEFVQLQASPSGQHFFERNATGLSAADSAGAPTAPSLVCNVTISDRLKRSIQFGRDNAQIMQTFRIDPSDMDSAGAGSSSPTAESTLDIVTSGEGLGTMSIKLRYNVFQEDEELCRFNIDSSIEEWQPPRVALGSGAQGSSGASSGADDEARPAEPGRAPAKAPLIEDDYFKPFNTSMLGELNLVHLHPDGTLPPVVSRKHQPAAAGAPSRPARTKRLATPPVLDLSRGHAPDSGGAPEETGWRARVINSLRARLPSWLQPTPSVSPTTTTTTTSTTTTTTTTPTSLPPEMQPLRRASTSRRSASTAAPLIVRPTGIPSNVKLNSLSSQLQIAPGRPQSGAQSPLQQQQSSPNASEVALVDVTNAQQRLVLLLRICVHHMSSRRDSEMAVIEVGIVSGFKVNEADLGEIVRDPGTPAMKFEISPDRSLVIIYMHYIPFSGPYCLQFRLVRDSLVYNLQPGYIRAYEYYAPSHSCSSFYTPSRVSDLLETRCDAASQVCKCAAKSLCPATSRLLDLAEVHEFNATSARRKLVELICAPDERFDLVAMVRLKGVRYVEAAKSYRIQLKVRDDLRGNLTKIMEAQRRQKPAGAAGLRRPAGSLSTSAPANGSEPNASVEEALDEQTSTGQQLDLLTVYVEESCIKNDPLLLHLAHPSQWQKAGELMVLFARSDKLDRRYFKWAPLGALPSARTPAKPPRAQRDTPPGDFDAPQHFLYMNALTLDHATILHDLTHQAQLKPRDAINNLLRWFDLRKHQNDWTCDQKELILNS